MANNRDIWYVKNVTDSMQISISDLPKIPTLGPGHKVDMLSFHTKESIELSKALLLCLNRGWLTVTKIEDGSSTSVNSTNAQAALSLVTVDELGGGGGGNPFDQSLNTTDNVQFNQVNIAGVSVISVYQDGSSQNQLGFNLGEQGFSMGYNSNRAIYGITLFGNNLFMSDGQGANGGSIFMDGGTIQFPAIGGNYGQPAYIAQGTVDAGYGGGLSLFCNATYELNWQNGVLTFNGDNFNGGGSIVNVANISGPSMNAPTTATATLLFDPDNLPTDGQLIVLTIAGNGSVFTYSDTADGTTPNLFNLNTSSINAGFITNVINAANVGVSASFDNVNTVTFTCSTTGAIGNQENGTTLANCTITNFTGGSPGPNLITVDSNLVVNGTLAFALPYTTLTEANNGINLDGTYDIYFLYVGTDNVQFTVNLPDPSGLTGRELTFINSGLQSEFYPSIFGNINTSSGNTYDLSNTTVKMLSDGTTWWITSQV